MRVPNLMTAGDIITRATASTSAGAVPSSVSLLTFAVLLQNLRRNQIGCGFIIVPMWHSLRLAEDYAMADILAGGRVIFGVGRGLPHP